CQSDEFVQAFSGSRILPGMDPHATCYGGHQFGNWAGQLGDGRAINLGEVTTPNGHLMLQLKGAGPTPFSRSADGLAVLRSSLREYLCSEAMHHLGIPTTRALSLIGTGEEVIRDILYDGHPAPEPGAVVCRVSSSFVRFGHFQMLAARQELDLLKVFTDFVIQREFPQLISNQGLGKDQYVEFFNAVCARTAELMVHWMRVGFVHGVMNTDNLSILGETIDYGPYGWLDNFDPEWTPNTTDAANRRYRYSQQPAIAQWNLMQLANALLPLIEDPKPLEEALTEFANNYQQRWQTMMAAKLGLPSYEDKLMNRLLALLSNYEIDMTLFFRGLA
ncbi:MAG TPA: YdiU family protein, partial [Gammaproteobacteria bacterium]|nr:YdiU family protein [Gammaproteobacteria bacterium]